MLHNLCFWTNLNNGRLNEVSLSTCDVTAKENFSTLLFDSLDSLSELIDCHFSVKRSKKYSFFKRITHFDCFVSSNHPLNKFVVNRLMKEYSSHCCASLSCSSHAGKDASF